MGRQWDGALGRHVLPLPASTQLTAFLPLFLGEGLAPPAMCCWSSISRSRGELALMRRP